MPKEYLDLSKKHQCTPQCCKELSSIIAGLQVTIAGLQAQLDDKFPMLDAAGKQYAWALNYQP